MKLPTYFVHTFTSERHHGNPAAVCILDGPLEDERMREIAAENRCSETAFYQPRSATLNLRWFTPKVEVDLCGHATLATAFVLWECRGLSDPSIRFHTRSGELGIRRDGGWITMDFPCRSEAPAPELAPAVARALGVTPVEVVTAAPTVIARFDSEAMVRGIRPDLAAIAALPYQGVIVTAPGESVDFVSRFFGPRVGIDEDPVTGSAHTGLVPFWSRRLDKTALEALQVSERGGRLRCALRGERVDIAGQAVLYLAGEIVL